MIETRHILNLCLLALLCVGCQMPARQKQVRNVDPALPMTLGRTELVSYLNGQHQNLDGWRSTSTRMQVRLPNGMIGRLKGAIACQAPQYFRLTASNSFAQADLGSNASRCWFYSKPGESAIMTWKHEDTALLQQIPTGVPYIDPNWLMLVLGITPLNPDDYDISHGPDGSRELWLTAIEQSPNGRSLRRVIKVDTVRGVIREHAVYDSEANPLVKAILSEHKSHNSHLIPQVVKLQFPQMDSEMRLTFSEIDTNPHLPDELWRLPDNNVKVVDLGQTLRSQMLAQQPLTQQSSQDRQFVPPRATLKSPIFNDSRQRKVPVASTHGATDSSPVFDTPPVKSAMAAPDWDTPASAAGTSTQNVSFEREVPPSRPKHRWGAFLHRWGAFWKR